MFLGRASIQGPRLRVGWLVPQTWCSLLEPTPPSWESRGDCSRDVITGEIKKITNPAVRCIINLRNLIVSWQGRSSLVGTYFKREEEGFLPSSFSLTAQRCSQISKKTESGKVSVPLL